MKAINRSDQLLWVLWQAQNIVNALVSVGGISSGEMIRLGQAIAVEIDRQGRQPGEIPVVEGDDETAAKNRGEAFLMECRRVINEAQRLDERAARVAIFTLCVMLDGSGEYCGPEYVLLVRENGVLKPLRFHHHDL